MRRHVLFRSLNVERRIPLFFFFPYEAEVPGRYRQWGTVGLILLCLASYVFLDPSTQLLEYGTGMHPVQWVTSLFAHAGLWHLLANLLFLWAFGLFVEGMIGWQKYLPYVLGVGVARNAIEQFLYRADSSGLSGSLGASSIVYVLIATAIIWSPLARMKCFWVFWVFRLHTGVAVIRIWALGVAFISYDLLTLFVFYHGKASTPFIHTTAAAAGLLAALAMLAFGWVEDDEGSLFRRKSGSDEMPEPTSSRVTAGRDDQLEREMFRDALLAGDAGSALEIYESAISEGADWQLPERDLAALTKALHQSGRYVRAVHYAREHLKRFPGLDPEVRLVYAALLVDRMQKPSAAMKVLATIDEPRLQSAAEPLRLKAQALIEQGVLELAEDEL